MSEEIWQLLDSRNPGGIETHVLQVAQGLLKHGAPTRVVFLNDYGPHPLKDLLRARDLPLTALDGHFVSLYTALKAARPRVLHTHGYKSGIFGRVAGKWLGIPVFSTYHAGEKPKGKLALYDWMDRRSAGMAAGVFAVSPQIAQKLPAHTLIADNFVDTDAIARSTGRQIAFVGRLSPEKGPDRFVRLAETHPQTAFHLYGDGPMLASLRLSAGSNVHFHGQQNDMERIWPRIGLLIMPSRYEGLPMAALEAMSRGIPLLGARVGALPELVLSGVNGWLEEQEDAAAFDARVAQWLGMTESIRLEIGAQARLRVARRYSSRVAVPQLLAHYQSAASRAATAPTNGRQSRRVSPRRREPGDDHGASAVRNR